jgi:hypothetical protein
MVEDQVAVVVVEVEVRMAMETVMVKAVAMDVVVEEEMTKELPQPLLGKTTLNALALGVNPSHMKTIGELLRGSHTSTMKTPNAGSLIKVF